MNDATVLWVPLAVSALAAVVLLVDVLATPAARGPAAARVLGWITILGLAGILAVTFFVDASGLAAGGAFRGGLFSLMLDRIFLGAGVLGALGAIDDVAERMPRRQGEYWICLLVSLLGMTLLPGARDLVLVFVAFELVSVPLYVLAAYAKTDSPGAHPCTNRLASEASIKLYLVGATGSAFTLFGIALLTGMTGSSRVESLPLAMETPLGKVGLLLVLGGTGYKIGMAPLHAWIPDTYQGASTPFVAFLSVAPKAAGVALIAVLFSAGLATHSGVWAPPLMALAVASMAVGNLLALPQTDLRRLLGFSGIAQMGYLLVAMVAATAFGVGTALFFLVGYVATNLGVFLVVHVAARAGGGYGYASLAGLHRRSPWLAASLLCFLLSLAGIPFVVGFWAKLYVLLAAWQAGLSWLVLIAIVVAVLGLFYYLRILKAAYMDDEGNLASPVPPFALRVAIVLCLASVVGVGLYPGPVLEASVAAGHDLLEPSVTPLRVAAVAR